MDLGPDAHLATPRAFLKVGTRLRAVAYGIKLRGLSASGRATLPTVTRWGYVRSFFSGSPAAHRRNTRPSHLHSGSISSAVTQSVNVAQPRRWRDFAPEATREYAEP